MQWQKYIIYMLIYLIKEWRFFDIHIFILLQMFLNGCSLTLQYFWKFEMLKNLRMPSCEPRTTKNKLVVNKITTENKIDGMSPKSYNHGVIQRHSEDVCFFQIMQSWHERGSLTRVECCLIMQSLEHNYTQNVPTKLAFHLNLQSL